MKLYMEESRRYVLDYGRKNRPPTVSEVYMALDKMPNGWLVTGVEIRSDGTAVIGLQQDSRNEVKA